MNLRVRSMLAWLIMAALCGAIGFGIVFYYSTNARPMERFAIVIDAGSTQTRSNLFRISIDTDEMAESLVQQDATQQVAPTPLGQLIKVQQVSSCINGGPVALLTGEHAARELIKKCLMKFSDHIKLLDFVDNQSRLADEHEHGLESQPATGSEFIDADELSQQMALINHRVNSITYLHMGATAGMRALEQLNSTRAHEKLAWMERAIGRSNSMLSDNSPYINQGYVGILDGSDEASFGWLSVNFVCDTLNASAASAPAAAEPSPESVNRGAHRQSSNVGYELTADLAANDYDTNDREPNSVGTLELGGASAQMAFQAANNLLGSGQIANMSLEEQQLDLFNGHYKLATRSDLCLGMSQAVLRLNYVLLHKTIANFSDTGSFHSPTLELVNACMQKGALVKLTGAELAKLWHGACLETNGKLEPMLVERDRMFRMLVTGKHLIEFRGTGNVDQCNLLLGELIEPTACSRYFSLCPTNKNKSPPPRDMPFVTISGYNHALNVLNLSPSEIMPAHKSNDIARLSSVIDDKLGGNAIDYEDLLAKTREFCTTEVSQVPKVYPKVNEQYQNIICLQLVYIRKLLTEFYQFDPLTSWSQIRFLVFSPKSVPEQYTRAKSSTHGKLSAVGDMRPDIGWTLGLLLNATSEQLSSGNENEIYFHHGATVMYILRTVILIMLACTLIAVALLVVGVIEVRLAQRRGDAYTSHGLSSSSSSSYDIRTLGQSENPQPGADGAIHGTSMLINIMSNHHTRDLGMS